MILNAFLKLFRTIFIGRMDNRILQSLNNSVYIPIAFVQFCRMINIATVYSEQATCIIQKTICYP